MKFRRAGIWTQFTDLSAGGPDTYVWNFGDGFTDNTNNPNPAHTYTTSGTYNVTLTAGYAASGCTNSITYAVDAFPRTVPDFSTNTPCLGGATNFTDLTTGAPNQWEWDFGDGSPHPSKGEGQWGKRDLDQNSPQAQTFDPSEQFLQISIACRLAMSFLRKSW